ncbi:MAG: ATP-binding protein [Planctomycetota bacterium]
MRHPWHALTELLAVPPGPPEVDESTTFLRRAREAWTETAARLGLVRLGWAPIGREGGFDLAFPCERALVKADGRRALPPGVEDRATTARAAEPAAEDEARIALPSGTLVAAAPPGGLPTRSTLEEVAALAAGQHARRDLARRAAQANEVAGQGRRAAAAAHDLRNELTRALLHAARGEDGDASEVVDALAAARELAQGALHGGATSTDGPSDRRSAIARPSTVPLRALLVEEARAASASARIPDDAPPRLRVRCPEDLGVLAEPGALGRAVRNLTTNALESSARRRARARDGAPGTVELSAVCVDRTRAGFDVEVTVTDDGVGLDRDALARLLDDGRASDDDATAHAHGRPVSTGLGTASLRLALEALASPFRMTSRLDGGAAATIGLRPAQVGRLPAVVVDADVRRGARRAAAIESEEERLAWVVARADAARHLASRSLVERIECMPALADVEGRAALARACDRQRIELRWLALDAAPATLAPTR